MVAPSRRRLVIGWIAVLITVVFASMWAYWGIVENFHEGWYSESLLENLAMLGFQYLLPTIVFCLLAVIALRYHRVGLVLYGATSVFLAWFFRGAAFSVVGLVIVLPLLLVGVMYYYGRPEPRRVAYGLIVGVPLFIIVVIAPFLFVQVSQRVDDGDYGMRTVEGNGLSLVWAPRGPGWPDQGVSYYEAVERCSHLSEDGSTLLPEEKNCWRLPTVDEAVRSMSLHNVNAGGSWNPSERIAHYGRTPDKETPLWDPHSQIIYYWTQDESQSERASIIVYNGGVYSRLKESHYGYLSFRAVKNTPN